MKIAIISMDSLRNPFLGAGQARATYEVAKRLAKSNKVTVYTCNYKNAKDFVEDNVSYKHVGPIVNNALVSNMLFVFTIPFLVRKIKADVIIENFNAPFSVSFAPLFTKIPIVVLPTMFNAKEFSKKYHLPFHWVEAIGMKFYRYMLPYSDVDSAKARKLNPNINLKIVPQGVGKEYFKIERKKYKHILFLSRFDIHQKGIDLLLESYAKAKNKIKYPLVIAGHGIDEPKVRDIIHELSLEKKVSIVGSAYGDKKKKLMEEAVFVAFPSRHDEMCLWTLEALASSLPIVCFDLPESKWISEEASLKASLFDTDEYAQKMIEMCTSRVSNKMGINARISVQSYKWFQVVRKIEQFLEYAIFLEKERAAAHKIRSSFSYTK
jgi:glycosyltransferase involved in cell wall biosynthesis